jgi:hypothetical protein
MKAINIFNPKKVLLTIAVAAIGLTGCEKFLDVNTNPNNPDSASPTLLLPVAQAAAAQVTGNTFQIYGNLWAQFWTQNPTSSQYRTLEQYNTSNATSNNAWLLIYRNALENADLTIKSKGNSIEHVRGMAYIMKAYTYQVATDAFGDIPLTQALQGNAFANPKYDTQEIVYDSIFNYIDKGIALLNATNQASPGAQDMVFQGNATKWKAFANTLKLRAYLRIAKANPTKAQAGVAALYSSGAAFLTEDASIKYISTGGNENPLYNEIASPTLNKIQNLVASATAVKAFKANSDPRLFKFYEILVTTPASDTIAYLNQGAYTAFPQKRVSPPSALVGGFATNAASATAPVKFMSASESYFLQAEAVARGWGTGTVATLYNQGVTASFTAVGLTAAQATIYLATAPDGTDALANAADLEGRLKAIITQKYYAMCGFQGFEAWTEWRRTGYPTFFTISAASTLGAGRWPLRVIYPNSELTSNLNFPGSIPIYTPVWWDK